MEVNRSSGDSRIDMVVVRLFRTALFTPAMIEGIRVREWAQFPMVVYPRSGGGGTVPSPPGVSDAGQWRMSEDESNSPARVG